MKIINALALALLLASVLVAGCTGPSNTPTPSPMPTATPIPAPTLTATPGPTLLPLSPAYMPQETTNGRSYPSSTATAIANGSKKGGLIIGEIGRQ